MKSEHQQRVEEFMRLAGQEIPDKPTVPSVEVRLLRAKLIFEEAMETLTALNIGVYIPNEDGEFDCLQDFLGSLVFTEWDNPSCKPIALSEVIDGCCDLKVVTTGTLSACGIHDEEVQEAVDANNLAKFGPGSYRRDDWKWIKPPGHKPPDIQGIIERQK